MQGETASALLYGGAVTCLVMMQRYLRYDHIDLLFETFLTSLSSESIGETRIWMASLLSKGNGRVT